MTRSNQRQGSVSASGDEVFAETASLSKKLITDMLVRMIESAEGYHSWALSDQDGARMVKLIKHKQRIICSSFSFQLNKHFSEFKAGDNSPAREKGARDWQSLGLSSSAETDELQAITDRYQDAFKDFDRAILKRLQACLKRSRASIYENPLQVKRLCESFQYAIDSLNLEVNFKLALYNLFADRFIESLGPMYRRIDRFLLENGMLPDVPAANIHLRNLDGLSETAQQISELPFVRFTATMLGRYDILAISFVGSSEELIEHVNNQIMGISGVKHVDTKLAIKSLKYDYRWGRIVD